MSSITMYPQKCLGGKEPRQLVTQDFIDRNALHLDWTAALRYFPDLCRGDSGMVDVRTEADPFGFGQSIAVEYLPDDLFFLVCTEEGIDARKNGTSPQIIDVIEAAQDFVDYMVFAWSKAMDERGLSSWRSIVKLATWMRLLSREDVAQILTDADNYAIYGRPALRLTCEELGMKYPDYL